MPKLRWFDGDLMIDAAFDLTTVIFLALAIFVVWRLRVVLLDPERLEKRKAMS